MVHIGRLAAQNSMRLWHNNPPTIFEWCTELNLCGEEDQTWEHLHEKVRGTFPWDVEQAKTEQSYGSEVEKRSMDRVQSYMLHSLPAHMDTPPYMMEVEIMDFDMSGNPETNVDVENPEE